jgi:hypothetical protein
MARNYEAEYARRRARAEASGYSGYGQQRRYRRQVRELLEDEDIDTAGMRQEDIDSLAELERTLDTTGTSGMSQEGLLAFVSAVLDMDMDEPTERAEVWAVIRGFYPRKGHHGSRAA